MEPPISSPPTDQEFMTQIHCKADFCDGNKQIMTMFSNAGFVIQHPILVYYVCVTTLHPALKMH